MPDPRELIAAAIIEGLREQVLREAELEATMKQFGAREFSAIHKGVTAHAGKDSFRIEISNEAYESGKESLEVTIATAIQQALDIRGAELKRVIDKMTNREKDFS